MQEGIITNRQKRIINKNLQIKENKLFGFHKKLKNSQVRKKFLKIKIKN